MASKGGGAAGWNYSTPEGPKTTDECPAAAPEQLSGDNTSEHAAEQPGDIAFIFSMRCTSHRLVGCCTKRERSFSGLKAPLAPLLPYNSLWRVLVGIRGNGAESFLLRAFGGLYFFHLVAALVLGAVEHDRRAGPSDNKIRAH